MARRTRSNRRPVPFAFAAGDARASCLFTLDVPPGARAFVIAAVAEAARFPPALAACIVAADPSHPETETESAPAPRP